jgi:hypothetical protein
LTNKSTAFNQQKQCFSNGNPTAFQKGPVGDAFEGKRA